MLRPLATLLLLSACSSKEPAVKDDLLPTCEITPLDPGLLSTQGALIVDANGRRMLLRGINTGGRSKFAPFSPFDYTEDTFEEELDAYLDRPVEWGLNVLRVPFSWDAMEPTPGEDDEEWLARYDALLDGAAERGLFTIVDFHQDVYSERYCGDGFPIWASEGGEDPHHDCHDWFKAYLIDSDAKQAWDEFWSDSTGIKTAFREMWTRMAERHQGRPGVVGFEIINEPGWGTANMATWERDTLTPFYSEMVAHVHDTAPDALIFFDGTGLDAVTAKTTLERPEGDNLVFAPHFYDVTVFAGGETRVDVADGYAAWGAVGEEWDVPVLVGEFGIPADRDSAAEYVVANFDGLDTNLLHGTYWEYSASEELWNHENLGVVEADGTERPELVEGIIRAYPQAIDGELDTWSFDAASATASLSFEATPDGVSELVLPTRLYGDNPVVSGSGACVDLQGQVLMIRPTADQVIVEVSPR
jgi:endoglycosylceramidase